MHMHRRSHGRIEPAHICRACNRLFIRKWCGVWPHSGHKNSRPLQGPHGGPQLWYPIHSPNKRHVVVQHWALSAELHHSVARFLYCRVIPQLRTPTVRLQWPTAVWPRCGPCVGDDRQIHALRHTR